MRIAIVVTLLFFMLPNISYSSALDFKVSLREKKKTSKKKVAKKSTKGRSIASVNESGINEQITALEARPKKTKKDYMAIADLYLKLKNYPKAIENLKRANKPQAVEVLDQLARVYAQMGDKKEEMRALELIKADGKASPSHLTKLGNGYAEMRKEIKAKHPNVAVISTEPNAPKPEDPSSKYAIMAIDSYRESINKAPKYEKAYTGLYELYKDMNNYYDARLIIIEAIEKTGEKKYWLNEFCKIEGAQNYHDNAKQVCQKAISKDPKNPDNHVYLALAYKQTENEDQARKILLSAAKQFKKSEVTQWNAGQMSCAIKNWEQSSDLFKQCVKVDASSGRCHLGLGKSYFELKKYDEALNSLLKACPYIKGIDVEIRRFSYDLEKMNLKKPAQKYMSATEKCSNEWFKYVKKNKVDQPYTRNTDRCFFPER